MPDLGKYAVEVGLAYGLSIGLIAVLVVVSVLQARKSKAALDEAEKRWNTDG